MTPNEVVLNLAQLGRELDAAVKSANDAETEAIQAKAAHMKAFAHAFLNADGAMDARKHIAILATQQEWLDVETAEAKVRACRRLIDAIHTRIDIGRSLSAALRAEISLAAS